MKTHGVARVTRRRFKRALRKWRRSRSDRSRRNALRAIKGYLHHAIVGVLRPQPEGVTP